MLQELADETHASVWVVGSLLFFIAVYLVVAIGAFRSRAGDLDKRARLALDDGDRKD